MTSSQPKEEWRAQPSSGRSTSKTVAPEAASEARETLALCAVLVVAAILRAIHLDAGLWYDEIMTLVNSIRLPVWTLLTEYTTLNNHILYTLSAKLAVACFGEAPWALRLPAMLFGVASVWALWWLARMLIGRREALLAAILLACSYHHIWFSQNARGYTGLLFFGLVATALFVRGLREHAVRDWVLYGIVVVLAMYMHLSAAFLFATHAVVFASLRLREFRSDGSTLIGWLPLLGFGLGGLLTLLVYAPLIPQMVGVFTEVAHDGPANTAMDLPRPEGVTEWKNPLWTAFETIQQLTQGNVLMMIGLALGGLLGLLGAAELCRRVPVFGAIPILHVPLTAAILFVGGFRIWPRYLFIDAGFALIFVVHGAFVAGNLVLRRRKATTPNPIGLLVTLLMIATGLFLLGKAYEPKQDLLGARNFVEDKRLPGDAVVSIGLAGRVYANYYAPNWAIVKTKAELDTIRTEAEHTWLVYSFPMHTNSKFPEVMASVERDFELLAEYWGTLGDGQVLVYRTR